MAPIFQSFADARAASLALTEFVSGRLTDAIGQRGKATLVVSGGRSPIPFFQTLSQKALSWTAVTVLLADERCVPIDHADSNTRLIREHLLVERAREARFFSLATPETAEATTVVELGNVPPPLDVVVLGMGEDGHTASLFPDSAEITSALDTRAARAYRYAKSLSAPHARLTLNAPALNETRVFALSIAGEKKRAVYERALKPGPISELPIRLALHHSSVPCHVFWNP